VAYLRVRDTMRVHSSASRALCEQLVAGKHDVERVGINASRHGSFGSGRRSRVRTVVSGSISLARSTGVRASNGRCAPLRGQMRADARGEEPGGSPAGRTDTLAMEPTGLGGPPGRTQVAKESYLEV
jgi:hypothetical protein